MKGHYTVLYKFYQIITNMRRVMKFRYFAMLTLLMLAPVLIQAQTTSAADKKAAELKKLETSLNTAKAKVATNERKLAVADSLITVGEQMADEAKNETKEINAEYKALDKENNAARKPIVKATGSKDKDEATTAKAELKALDTQYKLDAKAMDTRLKDATKKYNTGIANITKGKNSHKTAKDALKASQQSLEIAQEKYDNATAPPEESGKKKK
jgi:hypothetical protein